MLLARREACGSRACSAGAPARDRCARDARLNATWAIAHSLQRVWREVLASRTVRGVLHCAGSLADAPSRAAEPPNACCCRARKDSRRLESSRAVSRSAARFLRAVLVRLRAARVTRQANYAASNSFLDALAAYRNAHGLPARVSVGVRGHKSAWPLACRRRCVLASKGLGMGFLTPADAFAHLERALLGSCAIRGDRVHGHGASRVPPSPRIAPLLSETRGRAQAGGGCRSRGCQRRCAVIARTQSARLRPTVASSFCAISFANRTVQVLGIARVEDLGRERIPAAVRPRLADGGRAAECSEPSGRAAAICDSHLRSSDCGGARRAPQCCRIPGGVGSRVCRPSAAEPVPQPELAVEQAAIANEALDEMSQETTSLPRSPAGSRG